MADDRKDIPSPSAANFSARLREEVMRLMGRTGNRLDRAATLRDLAGAGIVEVSKTYLASGGGAPVAGPGPNAGGEPTPNLSPPPAPTGFVVTGALSNVFIECDAAIYRQGHGHGESVLYGAVRAAGDPAPTFADAVQLASFPGNVYAYPSDPTLTWHLWLKWKSRDGVESEPAGGINGLVVATGQNVGRMVSAMTGPGNPFKVVPTEVTLPDGSVVPPGTYTADAFIHNGQIVNAMIANLAVDNAKIASLSASKITAGSISVGEFIQSHDYVPDSAGWRISGNGVAEFSGVIVRGTVYATNGAIGGNILGSDFIRSATFDEGVSGWRLKSNGDIEVNAGVFRGALDVKSSASGARLEIKSSTIKVYDASGVLRVHIGDLAA